VVPGHLGCSGHADDGLETHGACLDLPLPVLLWGV
jgi:hypothetical protein